MDAARGGVLAHRVHVRYLEVDQQGVVFNMWYLAYFDDAMTALLERGGLRYQEMIDAGSDVQLVHTDVDWQGPLRWDDEAWVDVAAARLGNTSFTLHFRVRAGERPVATGSTVYVVIDVESGEKREIPPFLRDALGPVVPLHD